MEIWEKEIKEAISNYPTMLAAANSIGMSFGTFKHRAKKIGAYSPNQGGRGVPAETQRPTKIPLDEILDGKHPQYTTNSLKIRLLKEGILDEICSSCGIDNNWNGTNLVLQLDHINGISNDHRKENLRILCPNCHSQTSTFSGKNSNRTSRIKTI